MSLNLIPAVAILFLQLFSSLDCGTVTGRIYLTDQQKTALCSIDTHNLPITFCRNINADRYYVKPEYTDLMETTCCQIAKSLNFTQGTCMQSKNKFLGFTTSITEGCAITNSSADISTLDLNKGNQWIFIMFGAYQKELGDETQIDCPNGLKDFDATL